MIDGWLNVVHEGDALELLKELPDDSVDLVCTDPPYNISKGQKNIYLDDGDRRIQNYGEWDEDVIFPQDWVPDCARVLKESGVFISFYDPLMMWVLKKSMEDSGFEFFTKYYWVKDNPAPLVRVKTLIPGAEEMWVGVFGGGGKHYINDQLRQRSGAIHASLVSGSEYTEHPTQKPLKVIRTLVDYHCPPDGVVLDPFGGSGTTGVAAEQLERDWILMEQEEEYVEMARGRLTNETSHDAMDLREEDW